MNIERASGNKLIITLPEGMDNAAIQRVIDYFRQLELPWKGKSAQRTLSLTDAQLDDIRVSRAEISAGEAIPQEAMDKAVDQWLSEK